MIVNKFLRYLVLLFSFFFTNIAVANESIYYIDMEFIMNNSLAGKSIITKLAEKNISNQKKFQEVEKNLKNDESKIISQKNILSEQEYLKEKQKFLKKVEDYKLTRSKTINNTSQMKIKAQKTLINSLTPILTEYAQKNSISYIIPKQNIIIGKIEFDLTKPILEILNSKIKNINLK